ncbi:MAG: diaminopimelate epimerase [Clostridia bacterium]|nr:diaminopimelate epimerase [Clostridia bacterium]
MKFKFSKMQGIGNDYVYVNCFEEKLDNVNELAKLVSDRHFGIGSDGLVLIKPSDAADFRMDMYNSDGTQAQMCGNATRCVAKYVYERGLTDKKTITLETLAGIKTLELNADRGLVDTVRVNMGPPELIPSKIPVRSGKERFIDEPVCVDGKEYRVTAVSMGNPHAIVLVDDPASVDIEKIGPMFENHPLFPERINTEFTKVISRSEIQMRVWERGAGETLACGTGASATLVACCLLGLTDRRAVLRLLGGNLEIEWNEADNNVYMTGKARFVFDGEFDTDIL